ncbi:MAG: T9SS type A sorting domain-containing protein [Bacteroidales bacterium]|nr:T9SS type A sorting domain-containing protein [Bacteroidales bacterium]
MRNFIVLFSIFVLGGSSLSAQTLSTETFMGADVPAVGNTIEIPISVSGFPEIIFAMLIYMEYDPAVLSYFGVLFNSDPNRITVTSVSPSIIHVQVSSSGFLSFPAPEGVIVKLGFTYNGGISPLTFIPTDPHACEYMNLEFETIAIPNLVHGAVQGTLLNRISNGAWETATNWSLGILPDSSQNVIVEGATIITAEANTADLTIKAGGSLALASNANLTVTGEFVNEVGVSGLIIESSDMGTGSIIHYNQGLRALVQRYVSGPESALHQISSPVEDQPISPEFTDGSFFSWFEPAQSWISFFNNTVWPTWTDANTDEFIACAKGYMLALPYAEGNPQTKEFTGDLNEGAFNFNLSFQAHPDDYHRGFNLAGNPYPSSIDWKAAGWDRSSLLLSPGDQDGYSYWVWNPVLGQYGTYHSGQISETGTAGTSRYISPMQGFWVKTAETGTLGMDNSIRVHSNQNWLKDKKSEPGVLHLSVRSDVNAYRDEVIIEFGHETNLGGSEKMFSLYPAAPGLYTMKENKAYSINFLGQPDAHPVISVGFIPGVDGIYTIAASGYESFEDLIFEDLQTGTLHPICDQHYQFVAHQDDEPLRFLLRFKALGTDDAALTQPHAFYKHGELVVFNPAAEKATIYLFDANGRKVQEFTLLETQQRFHFNPAPGFYLASFVYDSHVRTLKLIVH